MANKDKKGTEEFEQHAREFNLLRPTGFGEKLTQAAGGVNVGLLANILGAPVDVVNWAIGGAGGEQPVGGSASIQRGLSAIGAAPRVGGRRSLRRPRGIPGGNSSGRW